MNDLSNYELLQLVARYTRWCLASDVSLEAGSARWCNLWDLTQAALGETDPYPQVPLIEVVNWLVADMFGSVPSQHEEDANAL